MNTEQLPALPAEAPLPLSAVTISALQLSPLCLLKTYSGGVAPAAARRPRKPETPPELDAEVLAERKLECACSTIRRGDLSRASNGGGAYSTAAPTERGTGLSNPSPVSTRSGRHAAGGSPEAGQLAFQE